MLLLALLVCSKRFHLRYLPRSGPVSPQPSMAHSHVLIQISLVLVSHVSEQLVVRCQGRLLLPILLVPTQPMVRDQDGLLLPNLVSSLVQVALAAHLM